LKKKYPTHLSEADMRILDNSNAEYKLRMSELEFARLKRDNLNLQIQLMHSKVLLLEQDMIAKQNVHKNKIGNHKVYLAELRKRHGVPEGQPFGHDPLSGELSFNKE